MKHCFTFVWTKYRFSNHSGSPIIAAMKNLLACLLFASACTADQPPAGPDGGDPIARGLDGCAADGVALDPLWAVDNLHGPMVALAIAPDGTAVVTTSDGAVKQWSLGSSPEEAPLPGGRPSYGDPFIDAGTVVRAVAIGGDGQRVLGADAGGALRQWAIADASSLGDRPLDGAPLTAIAALGDDAAVVADESFGGAMRVVPLDGGAAGEPLATALWGVTALHAGAAALYTAGHDYGMAAVERRDPASPGAAADAWDDLQTEGWVRDIDVDAAGARLAAAGDFGLAMLDTTDLAAGPTAQVVGPAISVAFTASGEHVAVIAGDRVILWDRALTTEIESVTVPTPVAVAVDPSGERLVVASTDGMLRAYACR